MITRLVPDIDLTKTYPGIILEDKLVSYDDNDVSIYIPIIMCDIPKGEPNISKTVLNSINIFKNSPACRPKCSSVIREKNYLIAHKEDLDSKSLFSIQKDSKAQVTFTQGKISAISFRLNYLLNI